MKDKNIAVIFAVLAAGLYAINAPLSKLLLTNVESTMMAALLYLGAGAGLLLYSIAGKLLGKTTIHDPLTRKELPYTVAMVILDIAAPILLMLGISHTTAANVSLLNNFEIVATSLIAFFIFKEMISRRLFLSIVLVTAASIILGFEGTEGFTFDLGSVFVLAACICWGFENNCTKMISSKSSIEIVIIKGCFSGLGGLIVALLLDEQIPDFKWLLCVLLLGFVAYGLSINFYIMAQKHLGASKTSAFYSIAPFMGVAFSMVLLGEQPGLQFYIALVIMIIATLLMIQDTMALQHAHLHTHIHTHEHKHGKLVHSHEHMHEHSHMHSHYTDKDHHNHNHKEIAPHNHIHT